MARTPLTDKEKAEIRKLNEQGVSQYRIARTLGRSQATVGKFMKDEGITPAHKAPAVTNAARRKFGAEQRKEMIVEGVDVGKRALAKLLEIFENPQVSNKSPFGAESLEKAAKAYQNVTISLATWIDKQRLEEGLPTSYGKQDVNNTHTITYEELVNDDGARGSEES